MEMVQSFEDIEPIRNALVIFFVVLEKREQMSIYWMISIDTAENVLFKDPQKGDTYLIIHV